jgi:molecular chaperone DnaJ
MSRRDYYKILQVFPGSSTEEIKKSYRRLVLKYHPDRHNNNEHLTEHFREIQEAYETLTNPARRIEYDNKHGFATLKKKIKTPQSVLSEANRLRNYVQTLSHSNIDQRALEFHLRQLTTEQTIYVLQGPELLVPRQELIHVVLDTSWFLSYNNLSGLHKDLLQIAGNDPFSNELIATVMKERRLRHNKEKILPWLVILITILLVWLMYVLV